MGLSIKNAETERLVRELARRRGIGMTTAIRLAVSNELAQTSPSVKKDPEALKAAIRELQDRWAKLPEFMTAEEVDAWMYDENGLPH
jgi:antitoxin VapB